MGPVLAPAHTTKTEIVVPKSIECLRIFERTIVPISQPNQVTYFRCGSNAEEEQIRGKMTRTIEAVENAVGLKSTAHFMAMPAILNK